MSININKYNQLSDYLSDNNKITDESIVSQVDNSVVYRGVNVMLKGDQLAEDSVCVVVKDASTDEKLYIPIDTYKATKLDTERYTIQDYILFGLTEGKKLYLYKNDAAMSFWAAENRYRLECDLASDGGFNWTITLNGNVVSGTVRWESGATLQNILDQLTPSASSRIAFAMVSGYITITCKSISNSTFTLSNNTGGTLYDLSLYCKVKGETQPETHRTWMAQSVASLFPDSGFLPANTVQYARNGKNLSSACGGHISKFKSYYRTNGSATYVAESSQNNRMSEAGFAAMNGSGNANAQALYDKYNGSWDAYMEASMIQVNDAHRAGMEFKSYNNGVAQNGFLASVMTLDFDMETWIPAYPAAANASQTTIDGQQACLPTTHQIALLMNRYTKVRNALNAIGGTLISQSSNYWLINEFDAYRTWLYNGSDGCISSMNRLINSFATRPVLAAD